MKQNKVKNSLFGNEKFLFHHEQTLLSLPRNWVTNSNLFTFKSAFQFLNLRCANSKLYSKIPGDMMCVYFGQNFESFCNECCVRGWITRLDFDINRIYLLQTIRSESIHYRIYFTIISWHVLSYKITLVQQLKMTCKFVTYFYGISKSSNC